MDRLNRDIRPLPMRPADRAALQDQGGGIVRFVAGLDQAPRPMTDVEVEDLLNDPLAVLLLRRGTYPRTLTEVLDQLDQFNQVPEGLPEQQTFLVGEGSQIRWSQATATVNRHLRFAVTRAAAGAPGNHVDLLISASVTGDPAQTFLQIMAWDARNEVFNFYAREGETWVWAGNSEHALAPGSRGQGPFDSHVNGTMVMKELKQPWINWNSMNAGFSLEVLAPDDPVRQHPLLRDLSGGEQMERSVVRPGVRRWHAVRVANAIGPGGMIASPGHFLRQLFETTTVNLISSTVESRSVRRDTRFDLPLSFFINSDALFNVVGLLLAVSPPRALGAHYLDSLAKFEFAIAELDFRQDGDTHFAFLVPEPAFEDVDLLDQLIRAGLLSRRLVACVLMVDFPNPIFSTRRARLMKHLPDAAISATGWSEAIAGRIMAASEASSPGSPEREFAANWSLGEDAWRGAFVQRITDYFIAVERELARADGFDAYVHLAESRRREFRPLPLNEARLLVPTTNIPLSSPTLQMTVEGTVVAT